MWENEKYQRLYAIAEEDAIYLTWKNSVEYFENDFKKYVQGQPIEIQNILWGYAEAGRMMMQHLVTIALGTMEFTDSGTNM